MAVHCIGHNGDAGGETPLTGIAGDTDNRLEGIEQGHDARRGKSGAEGGFVLEPAGGVLQQSGRKQHAALTVDGRGEQTHGVEREVDNGLGGVVERAQILKGQAQAFGRHQVRQHAFQSGLVRHGPQRNEFRRGQAGPVPGQCQVWRWCRFQASATAPPAAVVPADPRERVALAVPAADACTSAVQWSIPSGPGVPEAFHANVRAARSMVIPGRPASS